MKIHRVDENSLTKEYGILCDRVYPNPQTPGMPFGSTWCLIEPHGSTLPHDHHEGESFFIMKGQGLMQINSETSAVKAGDIVFIPPFSNHHLTNSSTRENLEFLSMWWPLASQVEDRLPQFAVITAAPPTPNGDLHLGHLSGPYVAADVYHRYLEMRGVKTIFLTGSDDNQSYVPVKGKKMGLTPTQVVDKFATNNKATLKAVGADLDYFLRPIHNNEYIDFVQGFFMRLVENGKIILKEKSSLHCDHCDLYLYEAHVRGKCPHCRSNTNGNGCESCGFTNDCANLIEPHCNHCQKPARINTTKRFYFPLQNYANQLREYYQTVPLNSHIRAMTEELLHDGLPEVCVSHIADWGIPVPTVNDQVIYEWFEMAAGYVYMAKKLAPQDNVFNFSGGQMVQFFGFDNSFFYSAFIPALLLAYDENIQLPEALLSNEFYKLEGEKFSTSRQHAIWGDDMLKTVPSDILRYYLSFDRPETEQTNFSAEEFQNKIREEFVEKLEPWLGRLDEVLNMNFNRKAPLLELKTREQILFYQQISNLSHDTSRTYSPQYFSLRSATRNLARLLSLAVSFQKSQAFLKHIPDLNSEWNSSVALELTALKTFALLSHPIMPHFSTKILAALGIHSPKWDERVSPLEQGVEIKRLSTDFFSKGLRSLEKFEKQRGENAV